MHSSVEHVSCYKDAALNRQLQYTYDDTRKYRKHYYCCPEASNYFKHSRIRKETKPVKVKAPHKAHFNNIY